MVVIFPPNFSACRAETIKSEIKVPICPTLFSSQGLEIIFNAQGVRIWQGNISATSMENIISALRVNIHQTHFDSYGVNIIFSASGYIIFAYNLQCDLIDISFSVDCLGSSMCFIHLKFVGWFYTKTLLLIFVVTSL